MSQSGIRRLLRTRLTAHFLTHTIGNHPVRRLCFHHLTTPNHLLGMSEAEIRVQLAKEEEEEANTGKFTLHEVTPSNLIANLLDLEEQQ